MTHIPSKWRSWFMALRWGGIGLLTAIGMAYTRKNLRAVETRAQSQFYGIGEAMIPAQVLSTHPPAWWVVLSPRSLATGRDSTSCSEVAREATAAQARVLMLGTCIGSEIPPTLSPDDTVRMSNALLMLQRAKLTAMVVSPDGGYVFGTRNLTGDTPAIRAILRRAQ